MHKQAFLEQLRARLKGLPQKELEERLSFYGEMIDDRIEEGVSEEEAVAAIGTVEQVFAQIIAELPLPVLVREKMKPTRRMRTWEIILLVLGSPVWVSLLVAALSVVLSLYVTLWSVVVSLWTVPLSLAAGALGGVLGCPLFCLIGNAYGGLMLLGAGLFCAGSAVFSVYGCKVLTRSSGILTKKMTVGIKRMLVGKGAER